ncbi:HAMP domain-containing sensor histidine kinase [uncultured Alistipes sp.]|jgi:Signal transduction histidine kinase|uniref:sensor histidine kinase n=1 Tax=uncultured Alistipes sp. TaxID=538949 RepID=UPI0025D14463|nr:HAMP domain-containing sensor histidine kinase [uncultured Alistipes sp.]
MSIRSNIFSFRHRVVVIVVGIVLGGISLLYTNNMAKRLKQKEQHDVALWAHAMERVNQNVSGTTEDPLLNDIVSNSNNIPFIITTENLEVLKYHLVPDKIIDHPDRLRRQIDKFTEENTPIPVRFWWGQWSGEHYHIIFYGKSRLLKSLYYFPYVQILVITVFIMLGFIAFRSTKHDEQNRVWIGLAKETAHQLGTPTSSLLGWIEYLRSQDVDQSAVEEMNKDLTHLMKIVDRFSKIGSETPLTPANINEVVGESVMYFRKRIPRNVTLDYNGLAIAPIQANINVALFEWVVENLMKNSLDALQGHGKIDVKISSDDKNVMIDVRDTGKGIPKGNWKRIFEPGFTTKTRGWGLGLSLSRRVIEDYHQGKIAVTESEIGKGTNIRVTLKRLFEA